MSSVLWITIAFQVTICTSRRPAHCFVLPQDPKVLIESVDGCRKRSSGSTRCTLFQTNSWRSLSSSDWSHESNSSHRSQLSGCPPAKTGEPYFSNILLNPNTSNKSYTAFKLSWAWMRSPMLRFILPDSFTVIWDASKMFVIEAKVVWESKMLVTARCLIKPEVTPRCLSQQDVWWSLK